MEVLWCCGVVVGAGESGNFSNLAFHIFLSLFPIVPWRVPSSGLSNLWSVSFFLVYVRKVRHSASEIMDWLPVDLFIYSFDGSGADYLF